MLTVTSFVGGIMAGFLLTLLLFTVLAKRSENKEKPKLRKRRDVKPGEFIWIEMTTVVGKYVKLRVIGNDPDNRKMSFKILWDEYKGNKDFEQILVFSYDSKELENFAVLNPPVKKEIPGEEVEQTAIDILANQLTGYLNTEEYEKAAELQKKINELTKTKNK